MFRIYKDVFFWSYVVLWLILSLGTWIITGSATYSILVVNPLMILIMIIIVKLRLSDDRFNNWLETPLNK